MNGHIKERLVLTFSFFVCLIAAGSAWGTQSESSFGVSGGVSSFNYFIDGVDREGISAGKGVYVGFFAEVPISGSLYLVPSAYHTTKVSTRPDTVNFAEGISTSSSYVETSAHVRWYFWDSSSWRAYIGAGPAYGIVLSAEESQGGNKTDISRTLARNDFSAQLGLGLEFPFSSNIGMQISFTGSKTFTNNLAPSSSRAPETHWEGAYLFASWRFKPTQQQGFSAKERAEEYLRRKNSDPAQPNSLSEFD